MMGMQFFYMSHDFYAGQFTKTLFPLFDPFDEDIALYFIVMLNKFQAILKGELVRHFESKLLSQEVLLPIVGKNIDFSFIRRYIATLKAERVATLKAYLQASRLADTLLTDEEKSAINRFDNNKISFERFDICGAKGLFDVNNTHSILKSEIVPGSGTTPYVGAGEGDNSIQCYISYNRDFIETGNSIMIGGKTLVVTYQEEDYYSNDSHNLALYYRKRHNLGRNLQLFLVSALYCSLKPIYSWGDSISKTKIKKDILYLPVTSRGEIDYAFMEMYISAQTKLCIRSLMATKDFEISETEKLIKTPSYRNLSGYSSLMAAEPLAHYGSVDVILSEKERTKLKSGNQELTLMYAVGSVARKQTQEAGNIALGLKEDNLNSEVISAYRNMKYIVFHYWKNEEACIAELRQPASIVDASSIPEGYLMRQTKNAKKYLLLSYNPSSCTFMQGKDILKIQRKGSRRYLPFVTSIESMEINKNER